MNCKIEKIFDTNNVSDSFRKREFVVEYAENPQYPELIKMEFIQDKCDLLDSYKVGDSVNVEYNLKGRKWTNPKGEEVYFNTIQAWKIGKNETGDLNEYRDKVEAIADGNDVNDDLPF